MSSMSSMSIFNSDICDSYIRDSDTSKEIQKYFKYFGLEYFDLNGDWYSQFLHLITNKSKLPNIKRQSNKFKYKFIKKTHVSFVKYFTITTDHTHGSYNDIIKCKDDITSEKIIMRISRIDEPDDEMYINDLYTSFLDNLKYIVLYIYCKCYIKTKIMPELYLFGYNYKNKKFYMIMEEIEYSLEKYINYNFESDISLINIKLCNIFKLLELLNDSGLKFKHSDLKYNNILIDKLDNPLLIDFGLSSFVLPNSKIIFEPDNIDKKIILNYHYKYPELDSLILDKLNITHDMILLISSCYYIKSIKTSIDFQKIMNSNKLPDKLCGVKCIINGVEIYKYIEKFFRISSKDEFITSHCQKKFYFDNFSSIDIYRDILNGFIDRKLLLIIDYDDLIKYHSI